VVVTGDGEGEEGLQLALGVLSTCSDSNSSVGTPLLLASMSLEAEKRGGSDKKNK